MPWERAVNYCRQTPKRPHRKCLSVGPLVLAAIPIQTIGDLLLAVKCLSKKRLPMNLVISIPELYTPPTLSVIVGVRLPWGWHAHKAFKAERVCTRRPSSRSKLTLGELVN
ncbi:hypothetical protein GCM10009566_28690 [Streptomyces murinus]